MQRDMRSGEEILANGSANRKLYRVVSGNATGARPNMPLAASTTPICHRTAGFLRNKMLCVAQSSCLRMGSRELRWLSSVSATFLEKFPTYQAMVRTNTALCILLCAAFYGRQRLEPSWG